jgi:hypothetical protein
MAKERVIIVGAGLCGSLLAARLRQRFQVTVVERRSTPRPLTHEIACTEGAINTTINRASGLGGTTNYWHNALIELDERDLLANGLEPAVMRRWYEVAWRLFLDEHQRQVVAEAQAGSAVGAIRFRGTAARMVVPQRRQNLWHLAQRHFAGDPIPVVEAEALAVRNDGSTWQLDLRTARGPETLAAERVIVCAGGLGTPVLLARSFGHLGVPNGGYHDHPMAYIAKVQLVPGSALRRMSGVDRGGMSLRTGFVYESDGIKAGIYLRPALGLGLRSITGSARYILSDLRNDPFSPRKILQLLTNPEAIREAVLFKTGAGLRGDYFSLLLLGEQHPEPGRGVTVPATGQPVLNWHVTPREHAAYRAGLEQFLGDFGGEILEHNVIPPDQWEYRTAAHHSGGIAHFQAEGGGPFALRDAPRLHVCDGSILRAGGIANSGLTLAALALQLADELDPGQV